MAKVTLRTEDGREDTIDLLPGESIMVAALRHGVSGILADCGGQCQCATCHVFVPDEHAAAFAPMSEDEDDMLEVAAVERTDRSRLSCQLVPNDVDEVVVDLPARQR